MMDKATSKHQGDKKLGPSASFRRSSLRGDEKESPPVLLQNSKKNLFARSGSLGRRGSWQGLSEVKIKIDQEELVKNLKEISTDNRDPLPKDIMWAWSQIDKDGTGEASPSDLGRILTKFNDHVQSSGDIVKLIHECDVDNFHDLDVDEMQVFLQCAGGTDVTKEDAQFVRERLANIANAAAIGGYNKTMTADPDFVSKAVFEWWWVRRGFKNNIPRYDESTIRPLPKRKSSVSNGRKKSVTDSSASPKPNYTRKGSLQASTTPPRSKPAEAESKASPVGSLNLSLAKHPLIRSLQSQHASTETAKVSWDFWSDVNEKFVELCSCKFASRDKQSKFHRKLTASKQ